ncbi:SRPBCC family protein [Actinocatenispora rupis]|uniref:Cyclase n=1 Tax=Actinocatenispora rupis TaxID=519421 RepID=A0A8J3JB32_9ACTN|nr:SRPBCC family protein [Actinocatenispora rupis]GID13494.1 cyclase [Actinocatenispora rupis]
MTDSSTQSIVVASTLGQVTEIITDFPSYPEWASGVKTVEVFEEYEDGYASRVRFVLDAGVLKDDYVLEYEYAEDLSRIQWRLVEPSKVQKAQVGAYDLDDNGDGTVTVTYSLSVELATPMLGMLRRRAEKMIMDVALKELKKRAEATA